MSNCGCSSCEDNLLIDPVVLNEGEDGSDGVFGGYSGDWLFESNTASPPSTRYLRVNNASLASITQIYISETNAQSLNYATFLAEFAVDSYIRIFREFNSNVFWLGKITSVTDSGPYYTIGVTTILSNGSFTNTERLILSYIPASTASNAVEILTNTNTNITTSNTSFTQLGTSTIPLNSLSTDGSELKIRYIVQVTGADPSGSNSFARVQINNADIDAVIPQLELSASHPKLYIDISFIRNSNTQACVTLETFVEDVYHNRDGQVSTHVIINGFNFTTNAVVFDIDAKTSGFLGELVDLEATSIYKYIK